MNLPQPRTTDQQMLAIVCGLLGDQNKLLADIRDRLTDRSSEGQPVTDTDGDGGVVKLKEPAAPPRTKQPTTRAAARKSTAAGRRSTKETT